ncbi:MAG TPA: glycosyltransferase family 4 protein, partial [Solirubrobacteraceae bacterium]|nr:glycosyltransferase family 4 protein [Solirubrobacteraceae bacterium]
TATHFHGRVLASYREELRLLTTSGWNRDRLAEMGLDPYVVGVGIDLETWREERGVRRRADLVLSTGRTNPLKNFGLTADAWRALDRPGAELRLFGSEPHLGEEHGLPYVAAPSDDEVNRLYNEATVLVSTSAHEGFALPPLEAMAAGCAVVCTDAHGNRDFCVDGENCLMPEPTPDAVAAAIARLLDDRALRERLVAAGRATARRYGWEPRIDVLEAVYEEAARARPAANPTSSAS